MHYYEHIHLAFFGRVGGLCVEGEVRRGLGVGVGVGSTLYGQPQVVEHVGRIQVEFGAVFPVSGIRNAERQQTCGCRYGGIAPLLEQETVLQPLLSAYGNDGHYDQRDVDYHHAEHRRNEIVKQLESLSRIGCHHVEEHVYGDD